MGDELCLRPPPLIKDGLTLTLAALNSIKLIHVSMPGCFVLRMDKFLPQCVGRCELNQDMMFIEGPPEFLRCSCDIRE